MLGSLGFNPDWKNPNTGCKFPPKVQMGRSFGALIFYLRIRPQHQKFHRFNADRKFVENYMINFCTINVTFSLQFAALRLCQLCCLLKRVCSDVAVLCPVIADGKHSYMDLSAERYSEHVMRPPVSSQRWTFTVHTHSHVTVSHAACSQSVSPAIFVSDVSSWVSSTSLQVSAVADELHCTLCCKQMRTLSVMSLQWSK